MGQRVPKNFLLHADEQQREKQHANGAVPTRQRDQVQAPFRCAD
jgi:hypothetical protein